MNPFTQLIYLSNILSYVLETLKTRLLDVMLSPPYSHSVRRRPTPRGRRILNGNCPDVQLWLQLVADKGAASFQCRDEVGRKKDYRTTSGR